MKKFFTLLLCSFSVCAFAQTAIVKGYVLDETTQKPIEKATITIVDLAKSVVTNADGYFVLPDVPYGKHSIEVTDPSHTTMVIDTVINTPEVQLPKLSIIRQDEVGPHEGATTESEKQESLNKADDDDDVPSVALTESDLKEQGSVGLGSASRITQDAFLYNASYVMTGANFSIRGYRQEEFSVLMNGVPVNDLEDGRVPTSSWGGLGGVTWNRTFMLGLGPSAYAFGGPGGVVSIDSRASSQRKGLNVSYSSANRNFRNRLSLTYNSGLLKHGWVVGLAFAKRWATEGYVPGTTYDGYSYYLSVDKHFGKNHVLSFTAFGAPTKQGRAIAATQEAYNLAGSNYYNPGWGYQNGVKRNANVDDNFLPTFILNHAWKISRNASLTTAAGFTFGERKRSGLDWYNAPDPRPDYYQYLPSYYQDSLLKYQAQEIWRNDVNTRQIGWDRFYDVNRNSFDTLNNIDGIAGNNMRINRSKYIVENTVRAQKRFNFNTVYNNRISRLVSISAGLTYQFETTENYKQVADLLGGQYYVDVNQYAQLTYPDSANAIQNDLKHPNRLVTVGDKYGYDYRTTVHNGGIWVQPQFHYKDLDAFVAAEVHATAYWRYGYYQNGLFPNNSYGKSQVLSFINYGFKAGLNYTILGGKNSFYLNGAYMTQAPSVDAVFVSAKTRDQVVDGVKNSKVYAGEFGYQYKSSNIKARATFFFTQFTDLTSTQSFYHDDLRTFVNYTLTGISTRNMGVEASIDAKIYRGFGASAVASIGRYIITSRPSATITEDNSSAPLASNTTVYIKNFNVAGSPQMAYSFGLNYRSPQFWFVNLYFNYYDWMWTSINPTRRTVDGVSPLEANSTDWQNIVDQQRLKGQFTMSLYAGYSWLINKQVKARLKNRYYLAFSLSVNNLSNNTNFISRGYEQLRFDYRQNSIYKFPPKYSYAYGANYMFTVSFRMN